MTALLLLLSCRPEGGNECSEALPCGFGETCIEGYCEAASCNTSRDCPIGAHCGPARTCAEGCETASDCYPGEQCGEDATCAAAACLDANLDCGWREFCNLGTGECYDAGEQYCRPCHENEQCGDGNYCLSTGYCGVDCSESECPAGFDCVRVVDENEQTLAFQCWSFCNLYEEDR